jgi:UrcA family protein
MSMTSKTGVWIYAAMLTVVGAWQRDALADTPKASTAGDAPQITVHFNDLNLDRPAGAAVLYARIRHAAESVCGDPQPPGSRITSLIWRRCVALAVERSVVAVDRPALTAYYRGHTKPSDQKLLAALEPSPRR